MSYKKVILRADGNNQIGLGHVYRLLALAEMLKNEFDCYFAINTPDEFLLQQLESSCKAVIQLTGNSVYTFPDHNKPGDELEFDLDDHIDGSEIIVTDGYLFGEEYQLAVKSKGAKLICVDDLAETLFYADIIINHAPGIDSLIYKKQEYTKVFTGLDYAILRPPLFGPFAEKKNTEMSAFVSLGGVDYFGYSAKLLYLLLESGQFGVVHVLCSYSFNDELLNTLALIEKKSLRVRLHYNLSASQLVKVLDSCTHAFVTASTVLIEAYARGLKCFMGFSAKNQQYIYDGFIQGNFAIGLGNLLEIERKTFDNALRTESSLIPLSFPLDSQKNLQRIFALA